MKKLRFLLLIVSISVAAAALFALNLFVAIRWANVTVSVCVTVVSSLLYLSLTAVV